MAVTTLYNSLVPWMLHCTIALFPGLPHFCSSACVDSNTRRVAKRSIHHVNDVRGVESIVDLAGPGSVHRPSQLGLSTSTLYN